MWRQQPRLFTLFSSEHLLTNIPIHPTVPTEESPRTITKTSPDTSNYANFIKSFGTPDGPSPLKRPSGSLTNWSQECSDRVCRGGLQGGPDLTLCRKYCSYVTRGMNLLRYLNFEGRLAHQKRGSDTDFTGSFRKLAARDKITLKTRLPIL